MIPELIILALAIGWISKGKLSRLADANIKHIWLIFIPLASYALAWVPSLAKLPWFLGASAIVEKIALIVLVLLNIRIPGMSLALVGVALNFVALSFNSGMMPTSTKALSVALGRQGVKKFETAYHPRNSVMTQSTRVPYLCDVIPAKQFLVAPVIYSVGDLVMSLGTVIVIVALMRTPLPHEQRPDKDGSSAA